MTTEPNPSKKKRKPRWWLTILVLLAIAAAIFLIINLRQQRAIQATIADLRTTPFARETLQTTINGTGNVRPRQLVTLLWQSRGTVSGYDVAVGESVEAGQILLSLDERDLPAEI